MQKCKVCGGGDFFKEAGYFFCQTCQTQNEDIREEILELRVDHSTKLRRTRIRQFRSNQSGEELGWTTWELYNFILIGLTNELIELGICPEIKLTILQLWATYLNKIEVAFTSTKKKCIPKLARKYNKRDAEIIYGKVQAQKRVRKRKRAGSSTNTSMASSYQSEGSSLRDLNKNKKLLATLEYDRYIQSQASSDGDGISSFSQSLYSVQSSSVKSSDTGGKVQFSSHAKEEMNKIRKLSKNVARAQRAKYKQKHISTQYKMGPHVITPMRLWAIIYLALRIHNQPIQLGDMLRYGREGHLSYYKLDHLLPPEVKLTKTESNLLCQNVEITHRGMRRIIASMAKLLGVWDIICPDFASLVNRYCQELGLPRGILLYTERLIALAPPKMIFESKSSCIPNYEGRAMAFIIVVLKILLAIDGITEYQISRVAEQINGTATDRGLLDSKLFSFREWQRYIECRKTILVHSHFPTKLKYSPNTHGIDNLYMKFLEFVNSKGEREEPEITNYKHFLPEELVSGMRKYILNFGNTDAPRELELFPPSLTPLHSYLQQLLDHPLYDIPNIVRQDFCLTKVGYMTKPDTLMQLALMCDIKLNIIDSNLHLLEKMVAPFEQARMPSIAELKELVDVQEDINTEEVYKEKSENFNDYVDRNTLCKMELIASKQQYYDSIKRSIEDREDMILKSDFTFSEYLLNGRLAIPAESDSENEDENPDQNAHTLSGIKSPDKYNLRLSHAEKQSISRPEIIANLKKKLRTQLLRNSKGQFIKGNNISVKTEEIENDTLSKMKDLTSNDNAKTDKTLESSDKIPEILENFFMDENINFDDINLDDLDIAGTSDYFNFSDISLLCENNEASATTKVEQEMISGNTAQFFRPFKDYWMYHCIFSRVKPKNFELFKKSLPRSFRWLLEECCHVIEMPAEDLYEEVCLIEAYHTQILKPAESTIPGCSSVDSKSKMQYNFMLSKW